MFYDRFKELCEQKKISVSRAATDIGLSNSTPTKWKKTGAMPDSTTLSRISNYFNVPLESLVKWDKSEESFTFTTTIDELRTFVDKEKAPTQESERQISDDDIKFALFGGDGEITDAMYEEVKRFAHMVKLREEAEKKKE